MNQIGYKTMNGAAGAYGYGDWSLPQGKRPGKWMPKVKPVLCESGYHWCRDLGDVTTHLARDLYEVEVRGETVYGDDKAASGQARLLRRIPEWNDETARLFAVDCARIAMNRYAQDDQRELLHACLDVTAGYADGPCEAAAEAAAWDAARAAAEAAAEAAARAAAEAAAWAAAWAAARDAAWAAAEAAAWAAARDEQVALLARYLAGEQGPFVDREG